MILACALSLLAAECAVTPQASLPRTNFGRDLCEIAALPDKPGVSDVGNIDQSRFEALEKMRWGSAPPLSKEEQADWDWCLRGSGFETLNFSADRKLAFGVGGWQSAPLSGGWGYCYYEKVGEAWRTLSCVITEVS